MSAIIIGVPVNLSKVHSTLPTLNFTSVDFITLNSTITLSTAQPKVTSGGYAPLEIAVISLFALIFCLGTIGNSYVFHYFGWQRRHHMSVPEQLFSILAAVDFLASATNPLLYIYWALTHYKMWHFGYWGCKFLVPLGPMTTSMSAGIFIVIAFDRQRSIVYPFKPHFERRHIRFALVLALAYAVAMNVHYIMQVTITPWGTCGVVDVRLKSYSVPTILVFLIQDLVLIFVFSFTNHRVFSHLRSKSASEILGRLGDKRKCESRRIIRLLVTLATVFFILTLPRDIFMFSYIISWFQPTGIKHGPLVIHINSLFKVLHTSNSCINFFIYLRMHEGFRNYILPRFFRKEKASVTCTHSSLTTTSSHLSNGEKTIETKLLKSGNGSLLSAV